jgi:PIN domain nuclease of toxin-antitoxin system
MGHLILRYLLDTCTFIWLAAQPNRLSDPAREAIDRQTNELFFSHVSAWEIHMKHFAGKLVLPQKPRLWIAQQVRARQVTECAIDLEVIHHTSDLPPRHKDPFDRLLMAQSFVHDFTIITPDPAFRVYPQLKLLW